MKRFFVLGVSGFFVSWMIASVRADEVDADLLIVGATESGWAAAVTAVRLGVPKIIIAHDGEWFGGQFTEQGMSCVSESTGVGKIGWGPDSHPLKRSFHRSGLFREIMDQIEWGNAASYGSRMPGNSLLGPSTFLPSNAEAIFRKIMEPYLESGRVEVFWNVFPEKAHLSEDGERPRLLGITFRQVQNRESRTTVNARMTIDASDWGEAIRLSGAAYWCGPDPFSRFGEPSAPVDEDGIARNELRPLTWAMILEETEAPGLIAKPPGYDARAFASEEDDEIAQSFQRRRLVDGSGKAEQKSILLLAEEQAQSYPLTHLPHEAVQALETNERGASRKNLVEMTREQREIVFAEAKNRSRSFLYHLQSQSRETEKSEPGSFLSFQLGDQFGTADRLPPKPFLRESLRLEALYMMREQDGRNRDGETREAAKDRFSEVLYPDGLFAWQSPSETLGTVRSFLETEGNRGPWRTEADPARKAGYLTDRSVFPARSLIPVERDGLLGAQRNLGMSRLVSAAFRCHDQGIHVGQAAAAIAAVSLKEGVEPREIPQDRELLEKVRHFLCGGTWGKPLLLWPWRDLPIEEEAFVAINRLSALGCLPIESEAVDFFPDAPASRSWKREVMRLTGLQFSGAETIAMPEAESRAQFCYSWWKALNEAEVSLRPFPKMAEGDADEDGIPDEEDALLFTPNDTIVWGVRVPILTPRTDGRWPEETDLLTRRFDFSEAGSDDASWDRGELWSENRGFGWDRDLTANYRTRSVFVEPHRDSFLFTREGATWEVKVEKGIEYEVTVCIGDAGNDQSGQQVIVEGEMLFETASTVAGSFLEKTIVVASEDGRLTLEIGDPGREGITCLCWLVMKRL